MIVTTITVTTAGTRVQASTSGTVKSVTVKARQSNTGAVYIGDSSVSSTAGVELEPGEVFVFNVRGKERLENFYGDAAFNGDAMDLFADNTGDG